MVKYENECCDCSVMGYPCLGNFCPNRHAKHYYCDNCNEDVDKLYDWCGKELCIDCVETFLDKIS